MANSDLAKLISEINQYQLPTEVIAEWQKIERPSNWTHAQHDRFSKFFRATQPPLCVDEALAAAQLFDRVACSRNASGDSSMNSEKLVRQVKKQLSTKSISSDKIAQRYPLYKAAQWINDEIQNESKSNVMLFQLWSLTTTQLQFSADMTAKRWYEDMLALRTSFVLIATASETIPADVAGFREELSRVFTTPIDRQRNLQGLRLPEREVVNKHEMTKATRISLVLRGTRQLGVSTSRLGTPEEARQRLKKIRDDAPSQPTKKQKAAHTKLDERITQLGGENLTGERARKSMTKALSPRIGSNRRQNLKATSLRVQGEADGQVEFDVPTSLTSSSGTEIYKLFRRQQLGAAAANTPTSAEMTRYPANFLLYWINKLNTLNPFVAVGCLMMWHLGIPQTRLQALTTEKSASLRTHALILNIKTGELRYLIDRVMATPSQQEYADEDLPSNYILSVHLPLEWLLPIRNQQSKEPFTRFADLYKTAIETQCLYPTEHGPEISSWARSAALLPLNQNAAVVQAFESGDMGFRYAVSSAYHQLGHTKLQSNQQQQLKLLADEWFAIPDNSFLELAPLGSWTYHPLALESTSGSEVYSYLSRWNDLYTEVQRLFQSDSQLMTTNTLSPALSDVVRLWNLHQMLCVWSFQFFSVGRRLGSTTQSVVMNGYLWHRDKESKHFDERKQFLIHSPGRGQLHPLEVQQQAIIAQCEKLRILAESEGWGMQDLRSSGAAGKSYSKSAAQGSTDSNIQALYANRGHLPSCLKIDSGRKLCRLELMTEGNMRVLLEGEPTLAQYSEIPLNLFRHVIATECPNALGQNLTDMLLGHIHPGADIHGYSSSANRSDLVLAANWLNARADSLGLKHFFLPDELFQRGFIA